MDRLVWGIALTFVLVITGGLLLRGLRNCNWNWNRRFLRKPVRPSITILLVVRNQEQIIEGVIRQLRWMNHWLRGSFDVIVVDNASHDRTAFILERLWRRQRDFSFYHLDSVLDPSALAGAHPWPFPSEQPAFCQLDLQGEAGPRQLKEFKHRMRRIWSASKLC